MQDKHELPKTAEGGNKHLQKNPKSRLRERRKETPKASKTAPEEPPESIGSNGQKKEAGTLGFDKAPGGSNVTFSNVFSLSEHPPGSSVLGPTGHNFGARFGARLYIYIYIYILI